VAKENMKTKLKKTSRRASGVCLYFFQPSTLAAENSKLEAPSSRETSSLKLQTKITLPALKIGSWSFSGCWMLDVGCFYFSHA
jgi:hypothetical protein